mgnify:CR=1 FL=1
MTTPLIDMRNISIGFTGMSGATLQVLRNIDPVSYTHLTLPTTPYV